MKRLMMYLKDYKKESILAPLFKLLEAFFELMVPLVMANIIDYGISNRNMGYIGKMGLLLLLLGVVGLASSITAQFFAAKAAVGVSTKLRQALFDHIEDLSFTDIDKAGTSTMITRMTSDVNQVQSGINMTLRLFLRSPIIVFGAMIMAFTIDVKCALIFVVAIPLLSIVVFGIILSTIPMYKKVQSRLDQVLGITRENLTGVRVIRAFHQEAKEEERFRENNEALSAMQIFVGKISACMNPVTYIIVNGAIIALIYTGAVQVNIGNLSQGEVVAIINYMNQILVELVKLANLIVTMTKALACADRVASVFEIGADAAYMGAQNQKLADKVDKSAPFLDFKHVSLTYQGAGAPTLQDMNFTVNRGDTVGIIGGTGSGKTSLVNLIPGFYPATEGEILLEGRDIKTMSDEELRGRIGVVPQKAVLFKGTIRSNLQWGKPDATEEEMWKALELAQASEVVEGKDGKLDATVAQNGKNFSGGQRQRIGIARALALKPRFVVCDEAVSALDVSIQSQIVNLLKDLGSEDNLAYLFISHGLSVVKYISDRIGVMYLGNIVELAESQEMFDHPTHPYTEALLSAIPTTDVDSNREMIPLEGDIPSPVHPPKGCKFHTRCKYCTEICKHITPELVEMRPGHFVACHNPLGVEKDS